MGGIMRGLARQLKGGGGYEAPTLSCHEPKNLGETPLAPLFMSASAAIADPLLRRAFGRRARPLDPPRMMKMGSGLDFAN
jgi:hypothetical protein